jgi:hypothetical protein
MAGGNEYREQPDREHECDHSWVASPDPCRQPAPAPATTLIKVPLHLAAAETLAMVAELARQRSLDSSANITCSLQRNIERPRK